MCMSHVTCVMHMSYVICHTCFRPQEVDDGKGAPADDGKQDSDQPTIDPANYDYVLRGVVIHTGAVDRG